MFIWKNPILSATLKHNHLIGHSWNGVVLYNPQFLLVLNYIINSRTTLVFFLCRGIDPLLLINSDWFSAGNMTLFIINDARSMHVSIFCLSLSPCSNILHNKCWNDFSYPCTCYLLSLSGCKCGVWTHICMALKMIWSTGYCGGKFIQQRKRVCWSMGIYLQYLYYMCVYIVYIIDI